MFNFFADSFWALCGTICIALIALIIKSVAEQFIKK